MRPADLDVDRLLREALGGEPPPDVESALRAGLRHSWQRAAADAAAARSSVLPVRLAAAAAALMMAAGLLAQLVRSPGVEASSWSRRQPAAWVSWQLAAASGMDAVIEHRDHEGRRTRYHVGWRRPGQTSVRIERGPGAPEARRELVMPAPPTLAGPARLPATSAAAGDPLLAPIEAYLTPGRVAERLAGLWRRDPVARGDGLAWFTVTRADGSALGVALDVHRDLPARIEAPALAVRLHWRHDQTLWRRQGPAGDR